MRFWFFAIGVMLQALLSNLCAMKIDRVILATNDDPKYIAFWNIAAPLWKSMGYQPTLALIAKKDCFIDLSLGDVIRLDPLPGISEALQTQVVRLFLPGLFPEDVCLISDIDMLPISRSYFAAGVAPYSEDQFVVYRDRAYADYERRYPMCYVAAKGSVFGEIFQTHSLADIQERMIEWHRMDYGWDTDELMMYQTLMDWEKKGGNIVRLGHGVFGRLDRASWGGNYEGIDLDGYVDCHCPRPYFSYRQSIDQIAAAVLAQPKPWIEVSCEEKPMVIVMPSYNNRHCYQKNIDSALSQNYKNFRIIYIDDDSPDGTGMFVQNYLKRVDKENRVTFIQNEERRGALANVYQGIGLCRPNEIVVNMDGDDWFPHGEVLSKLNRVYADPNVWVTYGQFVYYPCGSRGWAAEVPQSIVEKNGFREHTWVTTALRTFYAGLFHKIELEDLLHEGDFFPMAGDLAYMWPILEMAGMHSRFIPEVLYVYNVATPLNDIKLDPEYQQHLGLLTRARKKYDRLKRPYEKSDIQMGLSR